jgi:hypothetical protein
MGGRGADEQREHGGGKANFLGHGFLPGFYILCLIPGLRCDRVSGKFYITSVIGLLPRPFSRACRGALVNETRGL